MSLIKPGEKVHALWAQTQTVGMKDFLTQWSELQKYVHSEVSYK